MEGISSTIHYLSFVWKWIYHAHELMSSRKNCFIFMAIPFLEIKLLLYMWIIAQICCHRHRFHISFDNICKKRICLFSRILKKLHLRFRTFGQVNNRLFYFDLHRTCFKNLRLAWAKRALTLLKLKESLFGFEISKNRKSLALKKSELNCWK